MLSFRYDSEADILYIDTLAPYAAQESEELSDGVVARLNVDTGKIENLEILAFWARLTEREEIVLPVAARLQPLALGART
jgi:uncharacterized protein YuzE